LLLLFGKCNIKNVVNEYKNILLAKHQKSQQILDSCKKTMKLLMSAESKFAAFVRSYAKHKKLDQKFNLYIPKEAEI